jgi:hypothetical protein
LDEKQTEARLIVVVWFDQFAVDQSHGAKPLGMEHVALWRRIAQVFQRGRGRALIFGGRLSAPMK